MYILHFCFCLLFSSTCQGHNHISIQVSSKHTFSKSYFGQAKLLLLLLLIKLYNPGLVLACSSIPCQYFLSKTLFSQSSTPTIFRSPHTLSHHLSLGLPFGLFSNVGIQLVILLVIRRSSILCTCPKH